MKIIGPIETRCDGYRFRSRNEARYAVMFRSCGWRYEYEPEGFELPPGRYLPDFWLPDRWTWIEVKGADASPINMDLCRSLNIETGRDVLLFVGCPGREQLRGFRFRHGDTSSVHLCEWLMDHGLTKSDIDLAFDAARSARFEHGETPQFTRSAA